MPRFFTTVGVIVAIALIGLWLWFEWVMTEFALDYPTRLAGVASGYPPPGTVAYYWECSWAVLSRSVTMFFPYTIAAIGAFYTLLELLGRPVTSYAVSRRVGLIVTTISVVPLIVAPFSEHVDLGRLFMHTAWPGLFVLFCPSLWRHALIVLASWAGCVIAAMGVDRAPTFTAIGLGVTALNCYVIYRHSELSAKNEGEQSAGGNGS